jgi:hypothetical protein
VRRSPGSCLGWVLAAEKSLRLSTRLVAGGRCRSRGNVRVSPLLLTKTRPLKIFPSGSLRATTNKAILVPQIYEEGSNRSQMALAASVPCKQVLYPRWPPAKFTLVAQPPGAGLLPRSGLGAISSGMAPGLGAWDLKPYRLTAVGAPLRLWIAGTAMILQQAFGGRLWRIAALWA